MAGMEAGTEASAETATGANRDRRVAELEEQLAVMQRAATIAEDNELKLHRRLSSYLDAEIENRDAEIEELRGRIRELEGEPGEVNGVASSTASTAKTGEAGEENESRRHEEIDQAREEVAGDGA